MEASTFVGRADKTPYWNVTECSELAFVSEEISRSKLSTIAYECIDHVAHSTTTS